MLRAKTLYVLADGARARLVERRRETGHFATVAEIDGSRRLEQLRREVRASQPVVNRQSSGQRHTVGDQDFYRQAKEEFVAEVAERAAKLAGDGGFESVFVAAPARLIGPLRERIEARAKIAGALTRDLTKTPDAELPRWLDHIFAD